MTFVITWGHVGVFVAVCVALGSLVGWLISRFDKAQDEARKVLLDKIDERNGEQDKARLALREAINEKHVQQFKETADLRKNIEAAWTKIDKLMIDSVAREDFRHFQSERIAGDEKLRIEFKEDIDRLGLRLETAIANIGSRLDAFLKMKNGS